METITFTGLDPDAPYSLGNKNYEADLICREHGEITSNDIEWINGWNDGVQWTHPVCKKCGFTLHQFRPV